MCRSCCSKRLKAISSPEVENRVKKKYKSYNKILYLKELNSFPFKWQTKALPYLGISLTPNIDTLYQTNYAPLYKKMIVDLERWEHNPPSWFGRLNTIKINLLPRLLYLFRTLPIQICMPDPTSSKIRF